MRVGTLTTQLERIVFEPFAEWYQVMVIHKPWNSIHIKSFTKWLIRY